MNIEDELKIANEKGVSPPQNWTHRAIDRIENLKCCGNCIIDGDDCDYRGHSPQRYCDRYMSDGLTRKEREGGVC